VSTYHDELETRDAAAREASLIEALRRSIDAARAGSAYWQRTLGGVTAEAIRCRSDLACR
jgi:hypothetical protein